MDHVKPTLEGMPMEIQVEILRHLLRRDYSIELCPLDWQSEQSWGFGSLGILRVSKHFSDVSLGILYGENTFALQGKLHFIPAEWEHFPTGTRRIFAKYYANTRWSTLKDMPQDVFSVSSLDCLDIISHTTPGQERLRKLSVNMSYGFITLFMKGLIPQTLKRLRALQSVELILKDNVWMSKSAKYKRWRSRSFDHDFLDLIKNELAHIKIVTIQCHDADDGACRWISEQLRKRNRAWTPPLPEIN